MNGGHFGKVISEIEQMLDQQGFSNVLQNCYLDLLTKEINLLNTEVNINNYLLYE